MVNRRAESLLGRKRLPSAPSIETDKPPAPPAWDVWSPNMGTAFKLLMSARLCAALWSIVSDCDETFNYWEPAHFLYTGKGLQTWEYSPEFALRSYSYILLHVLPMRVLATVLGESSILVFYMTRCLLGLACALSELLFYRGICAMFGGAVGRLTLVVMLFAAGMFTAAAAFLPSSFSMYLTMVAYGAWMLRKDNLSILAIAASTIIGWPFAVALGVPIAVDILFLRRKMAFFIKWCAVGLVVFLVPMIAIDQHFYGRLVIAPLNIVLYNVFSSHGPDLYGTEPLSYYLINGFLNYNFAFVMALCSLPFLLLSSMIVPTLSLRKTSMILALSPMYIWFLIFFTTPHKEERFLFPIYPFIALAAALVLDGMQRLLCAMIPQKTEVKVHYSEHHQWITASFSLVFAVLCLSRIVAVHQGYHAPIEVFVELHRAASNPKVHTLPLDKPVNVCVGKEWYRYPSSFFLPGPNWNLQFLQSEFKGQLPKYYEAGPDATRMVPSDMNDMNKEETSRYVDITRCHYLIDRDTPEHTSLEPPYSESPDWTVIKQVPFLDAGRSHRILRAFYIPFLSSSHNHYTAYSLLKTKRTKKSVKHSSKT